MPYITHNRTDPPIPLLVPIANKSLGLRLLFHNTENGKAQVLPSKNDNDISLKKAIIIASLMSRFMVDVGKIIWKEIMERAIRTNTSLPFSSLITALCQKSKVPKIDRIDRWQLYHRHTTSQEVGMMKTPYKKRTKTEE
ncbi:hypothetical protein RND71_008351 [Anisodus tanguticus]|uniref:Putative plant transposon protein domain-containing protein n=1 Tax=Anisodus tanguticus TaxID=243964 RepID=A0AAE1VKY3_9SOLA|nr:hypothetical protein RND71_008351 [Anisodus tanguticus]